MISALLKQKTTILYGLSLAALLFLMRWLELRYFIFNLKLELFVGAIAIVFMGLGIWVALKLARPKKETIIVEKEVFVTAEEFNRNGMLIEMLGLSVRELEVLQLMAEGLSNAEIAERLFVSVNTVKTHSSRLFEKLEVKRRTQAVEFAKRYSLIP